MKKLPNIIVAFAPPRGSTSSATRARPTKTMHIRGDAGALVCRWRRDRVSGRLHCVWSFEDVSGGLEDGARLSLAA